MMFCDYSENNEYINCIDNNNNITSFISSFFIIWCSIVSGLSIGTFIVAQFMYPSWQKSNSLYELNCEDEEEDEDYDLEEEEEEEDYTQKYMEEFKSLPSRSLSLDEIKELKTKTVEEFVKIADVANANADVIEDANANANADANANANADAEVFIEKEGDDLGLDLKKIIMTYNNETESFWYYTDYSTKILYPVLDMVARKFVITYDCKDLYVSLAPTDILVSALLADAKSVVELDTKSGAAEATSVAATSVDATSVAATSVDAAAVKPVKSIFAKFKMYNSEPVVTKNNTSSSTTASTPHIIKKTNQFKYKGKLKDFSPIKITTTDLVDTETKIDYASFKKQYNLNKI